MKVLQTKPLLLLAFLLIFFVENGMAQQGKIYIQQDPKLTRLVEVKKELNKTDTSEGYYKIQIYNGNLDGAKKAEANFKALYPEWPCSVTFETPNYKVKVGRFETRLDADRYLIELKKNYPEAFLIKP